jgi:Response regulator containing CheY-like receiver, AAA-type ATPase, and DNA-binding domains
MINLFRKVILFVDNRESFLDVYTRLLEDEGYEVIKALNLDVAYEILKSNHVHLAILDIRMEEEDDPNDISGLEFALKKELAYLPKIILTAFSNYDYVRQVLEPYSWRYSCGGKLSR